MFEDLEYRHTAAISRNAWFLRFWSWMWKTSISNADFCKLFWGYVFAPVNLTVRAILFLPWLIVVGFKALGRKLDAWIASGPPPQPKTPEERKLSQEKEQESAAKKKAREERILGFFKWVSTQADRCVGFAQSSWPKVRFLIYGITGIFAAALAAVIVYFVIKLVELIADNAAGVGRVALEFAGIVVGAFALVAIFVLIMIFIMETRPGKAIRRFFDRVFGAFFRAMYMGLCAVKTRTCPKIELVDPQEPTAPRQTPST